MTERTSSGDIDPNSVRCACDDVLTPIESPGRDFLRSQPACVSYAERMFARFFPELVAPSSNAVRAPIKAASRGA